jgi:hypothetical protein
MLEELCLVEVDSKELVFDACRVRIDFKFWFWFWFWLWSSFGFCFEIFLGIEKFARRRRARNKMFVFL